MSNKGFTLIECLLVLSVISVFTLAIPFLKPSSHALLNYQMQLLYEKLLYMQNSAMAQKKEVSVDFHGNLVVLNQESIPLKHGIICNDTSFAFTPLGSVTHATTVYCSLHDAKRSIVVELGSGRLYVR